MTSESEPMEDQLRFLFDKRLGERTYGRTQLESDYLTRITAISRTHINAVVAVACVTTPGELEPTLGLLSLTARGLEESQNPELAPFYDTFGQKTSGPVVSLQKALEDGTISGIEADIGIKPKLVPLGGPSDRSVSEQFEAPRLLVLYSAPAQA